MKLIKKIYIFILISIVFLFLVYGGIYLYAWMNPKLVVNSANSYYFYDSNENIINGTDEWISYEKIDKDLINATLAIEDRHFFSHHGFDFLRIMKALYNNFLSGSKNEGASTITQQYAKNLYLDFDKTWERKINEAWLTVRLETHYKKEDILEGYLNSINYGGVFGIENASKYYFNKSASDLTLAEASILAGIPNRPTEYSPINNFEASKKRQLIVLNSMLRDNYITEQQLNEAYTEELIFENEDDKKLSSLMYFQDTVINELNTIKSIPSSLIQTGGLKIYTTLDLKAQEAIENSIKNNIKNDIQVASVVMKPNGAVLGLTGGVDYKTSQYNRALSSNRSVGSTIKPFLYYAALENNFTSSTTFTSEKTTFVFDENETYSPTNYGNIYPNSEITLASAIAYSDNIYAVKTHLFLGTDTLVDTMNRVGINSLDSIPSLALGSQAISLLEMTNAYAILANGGIKSEPYFIERIEDTSGNILYEHKTDNEVILNKNLTFILSELLSNTASPNFIGGYTNPTAYIISHKLTKKYAIKTGTTDFDHLVFGYNKDIVVGVWSGYDDNKELQSGDATTNKNMWADIIESYLDDKTNNWYSIPNNVVGVLVDPLTGALASEDTKNPTIQYYLKGSEPNSNYNLDEAIPTIKIE